MKLTYISYEAVCPSEQQLYRELKAEGINAAGIVSQNGMVCFSASIIQKRRTEAVLRRLHADWTVSGRGLFVRAAESLGRRAGLLTGAVICGAALIVIQDRVVNIEVLTDDPGIEKRVTEVLSDCGVKPGTYIPSIERSKTERTLRQTVEGISWAGITLTDCSVIVDVLEDIPEPKRADDHCPTHLVAKYDAVVDKPEILNGTLVKPVGSGVVAGEVLVSGVVPVRHVTRDKEGRPVTETTEKYVRSIGKVYGSFTLTESFTQPFEETGLVYSPRQKKIYSIQLFSTELPLYTSFPAGMISRSEKTSLISEELPVGIKTVTCTPYSFRTVLCSREQAEQSARRMEKRYVRNFLDSYQVQDRTEKLTETDTGVTLTVTYRLYGDICEEQPFFVFPQKNKADDTKEQTSEDSE